MIYLDNAATSGFRPDSVVVAVDNVLRNLNANPGRSGHRLSLEAARVVFEARRKTASFFSAPSSDFVFFAQNATQALNTAILGGVPGGGRVVVSAVEHNAVLRPLEKLRASKGVSVSRAGMTAGGGLDLDDFRRLAKGASFAVLTGASNVTGRITPIADALDICKAERVPLLVDAAQTAGSVPVDLGSVPADYLAFTGHKGLMAPPGTGGLVALDPSGLEPLMYGGTGSHSESEEQPSIMPDRFESGTLNTPAIAGLGAAVDEIISLGLEDIFEHKAELVSVLIDGLSTIEGIRIFAAPPHQNAGVVSFTCDRLSPSEIASSLDRDYDIMCRPGLHCAPSAHRAIGTFPAGTVRLSVSFRNSSNDAWAAVKAVSDIVSRSRR